MKKQRGITLISLVVTIIVLIILAGISINLTLGQDGIITKARQAKQNIELAQVEEQEQLNELYFQMVGESINSTSNDAMSKLVEFKKQIASAITDMGVATSENADATTMSSNIRSISGASSADKVSYDNKNSGLAATNVQGAIDETNNSLGKVLWKNSSPESGFVAQNITLSSDDYDYLIFIYRYNNNYARNISAITLKGEDVNLQSIWVNNNAFGVGERIVTWVSDTEYSCNDAYSSQATETPNITAEKNNNSCIPYVILGCKFAS